MPQSVELDPSEVSTAPQSVELDPSQVTPVSDQHYTGYEAGIPGVSKPELPQGLRVVRTSIPALRERPALTDKEYAQRVAGEGGSPDFGLGPTITGGMESLAGAHTLATGRDISGAPASRAGGAAQMISGAIEAATPGMAPAIAAAPLDAAIVTGIGTLTGAGAQKALQLLNAPEGYQQLGGVLAGLAGGTAAGFGLRIAGDFLFRRMLRAALQDKVNTEYSARANTEAQQKSAAQPKLSDLGEITPSTEAAPGASPQGPPDIAEGEFEDLPHREFSPDEVIPAPPEPGTPAGAAAPAGPRAPTGAPPEPGTTVTTPSGITYTTTGIEEDKNGNPLVIFNEKGPAGEQKGRIRPLEVWNKMVGAVAPPAVTAPVGSPAPAAEAREPIAPAPTAGEVAASPSATPPQVQSFPSNDGKAVPYSGIVDFIRTQGKPTVSDLQREFDFSPATASAVADRLNADGHQVGGEAESGDRRVTGTAPIPLTPEGVRQSEESANQFTAEPWDSVISSPSARAMETAQAFGVPTADRAFDPRHGGEDEGQPADQVQGKIADLMLGPDKKAPGISPLSGVPGESYSDFEHGLFTGVQNLERTVRPNQRAIVVTHGGDLQAINAWGKAGYPADFKFDHSEMAKEPYWSAIGQLFKLGPNGLEKASNNKAAGIYFTEHGETQFNAGPKEEAPAPSGKEAIQTEQPATAAEERAGAVEAPTVNKYASTQFNLPPGISKSIRSFAAHIPEADLAEKGREDEPHATLKYGLHTEDPEDVRPVLAGEKPVPIKIGRTSIFKTPDADVLKLDIDSPELHALNKKVSNSLEHTDTFPTYSPHSTIAYLKPGKGEKYAGKFVVGASGTKPTLDTVSFSNRNEEKTQIPLTGIPAPKVNAHLDSKVLLNDRDRIEAIQRTAANAIEGTPENQKFEFDRLTKAIETAQEDLKTATDAGDFYRNGLKEAINAAQSFLDAQSAPVATLPLGAKIGAEGLADAVYQKLKSGQSLGNVTEFNKLAEQYFGSSRASGNWTPKDAFDAMEAGVNKHLIDRGPTLLSMPYEQAMTELNGLMDRITSQGIRTEEQIRNQQFSTPPTEAFTAAKLADITPGDIVLEPSAGVGGLAVWPKSVGNVTYVNEISDRRRKMLEVVGFPNPTAHNGEIINALLDPGIHPTVVLMNPPFSAGATTGPAKNNNKYGFNHVDSALQRLAPNGRLIAILGGGRSDDLDGGASLVTGPSGEWFRDLAKRYNVRANVRIHGKIYQKYGTAFATRLIVIDKNGPTPSRVTSTPSWNSVVKGVANTLEEAYTLLKDVAQSRPAIETAQANAGSVGSAGQREPGVGEGSTRGLPSGGPEQLLPGGTGATRTGALGRRPSGPGRSAGGRAGVQPSETGERTDLRESGVGSQEPSETPAIGPAQGSAQNAHTERPLPNEPGDVAGGSGLTRQQLVEAAARRLAEKTGRARVAPTTTPAPTVAANPMATAAQEARDRLRAKLGKTAGTDPTRRSIEYRAEPDPIDAETLTDLMSIGAEHILNGATNYPDWSNRFANDVGDLVDEIAKQNAQTRDDIFRQVYDLSREVAQQFGGKAEPAPSPVPPQVAAVPLSGMEEDTTPLTLDRNLLPKSEEEDSAAYVTYRPTLKGPEHPGSIVETKTMATVPLPPITYKPNLPESVLKQGNLSAVQLEAVAIAGQQNNIILPGGYRGSALIGDGCVAAGTRIYNPVTKEHIAIEELVERGSMHVVLSLLKSGLVPRMAHAPFLKGVADLYRVVLQDGREATVTDEHRFLTPLGWRMIRQGLLSGDSLAVAEDAQSSGRVDEQNAPLESALSYSDRPQDCLDHCWLDSDPCDEPPRSAQETCLVSSPLRDDVHERIHGFPRMDAQDTLPVRSHQRQQTDHHSRSSSFPSEIHAHGQISGQGSAFSALVLEPPPLEDQLFRESSTPCFRAAPEDDSHRLEQYALHCRAQVESQRPVGEDSRAQSLRPHHISCQGHTSKHLWRTPLGEHHEPARVDSASASDQYSTWMRIESITFVRRDSYYDMYVPGPENYVAEGIVHHNTGVGKNSIALGILWDNWRQGRKRLVFVSPKWDLIQDAMRDLDRMGAHEMLRGNTKTATGQYTTSSTSFVQPFSRFKYGDKIKHDGILFSTYALIRSESNKGGKRITQLEEYLRGDDDGEGAYIVYDESHTLKSAVVSGQGAKPSQIGKAVKELMQRMPKLRSTSLSATAATDVVNLGYLDRLGLWGPGTPFPTGFNEFATQISGGKLAAMEMVARELKAQGKYLSRTLSFKGVTYTEEKHSLSDDQKEMYRTAAKAWASVVQRAEASIRTTTNGGARQVARFLSNLGSAQQRFFGILITALKTPTAIELANAALAADKSVVITLVNTNEAAQDREKNKAVEEGDEEVPDYDFGPKRLLIDLVKEHFPVQQYRDDVDDNGNPVKVAATTIDADGREINVQNPEAVKERDELIAQLDKDLHMPENPLDILINSLGGPSKVAELTGRKERFDGSVQKFVPRGGPEVSRKDVNIVEMRNFQSGKKRVAVLSGAADTGISLHSGLNVENQQQRYHITLQVGWSAEKAMQMLGRTHRTNQAHPPEYVLLVSDLGGEKRFISTISRRLGSLGALTKGQKDATSGTDLMDKVNFETEQGAQATTAFYDSLMRNGVVPGTNLTGMQILTDLRVLEGYPPTVPQKHRGNVTRLLNRLLALDPDVQNPTYNYFYDIFQAAVERAIEAGTLDTGVKTLPGDEFSIKEARAISKDPKTGADTFYYPIEARVKTNRVSPAELDKRMITHAEKNPRIMLRPETKKLALAMDADPIVHASGGVEPASYVSTASQGRWVKTSNYKLGRATEIGEWAKDEFDDARSRLESATRAEKYHADSVARNAGKYDWQQEALDDAKKTTAEAQRVFDEKQEIAKDPTKWAKEEWARQYEDAPGHVSENHHLIGGAVMRFWNPIREASAFGNIYTTVDSKTGQRVVGVDIPEETIGSLLQRITGGASTVNTRQLILDVLKNNLNYTLEGNLQVRRGRVGRESVIQIIPANQEQAQNLKSLGVVYERGVVPMYYIPNNDTGPRDAQTYTILRSVLNQYPVQGDQGEPERAAHDNVVPIGNGPRGDYRNGILWVNPEMMNKIVGAIGGPKTIGGMYIPARTAQDLPDRIQNAPSVQKALRDAIADNGSIVAVVQRPGEPISAVIARARHELFHAAEQWSGNGDRMKQLMTVPADAWENPDDKSLAVSAAGYAKTAIGNLGKLGYPVNDPAMMFSEIGAHLASGPRGWEKLGLSGQEAKDLFSRYRQLLPDHVIAEIKKITPFLKRELYAEQSIRTERTARQERQSDLGVDRRSGEQLPETGGGAPGGSPRRSVESNIPARDERNARSGEIGSAPILTDLISGAAHLVKGSNYSTAGAIETATTRGLGQVKRASTPLHEAFLRAASPQARIAVIMRAALPQIHKALEGSHVPIEELFKYYADSRLQALRSFWSDLADQAQNIPTDDLEKAVTGAIEEGSSTPDFVSMLNNLEGKAGIPENPTQVTAGLAEQRNWDELRDYLSDVFTTAAANVRPIMDPADFEYVHGLVKNDPKVRDADRIYGDEIEKPLRENHELHDGAITERLGPANRYIPLIAVGEGKQGLWERLGFKKPKNAHNIMATGLSRSGYTVALDKLRESFAKSYAGSGRAAVIDAARAAGLQRPVPRSGNTDTSVFKWRGVEYPAKKVLVSSPRMIVKGGKTIHAAPSWDYMPTWYYNEVKGVLDKPEHEEPGVIRKALDAINTYALQGPADLTFHAANIAGALVGNTPFLSDSLGGAITSSNIITKKIQALALLASVDPTEEDAVQAFREMADAGALPARYASVTYSKKMADASGAKLVKWTLSPMIYGPKGIDARARYIMWKVAKAVNPDASPRELNEFVNQLGNYTPALWSSLEQRVKSLPFSPFFTAGSTMIRNGVNVMFSSGPVISGDGKGPPWIPKTAAQWRIQHMLTVGAVGTLALWFLLSKEMTGKYPWQDRRSKFLSIPVGGGNGPADKYRHSKMGNWLWGSGPEVGYLGLYTFNPLFRRGAAALGIPGFYEAKMRGASTGQALEAAQRDSMNTLLHPFLGPEPRAAWTMATGREAYLTSLRDRNGAFGPSFMPAIPPKTAPGFPTLGRRALAAGMELNAFSQTLGDVAGIRGDVKPDKGRSAALNDVLNMSVLGTGLVGTATNPYAAETALREQRRNLRTGTR